MAFRRHGLITLHCGLAVAMLACAEGDLPEAPSPSLSGTETDGVIVEDSAGRIVVDRDAQWLFDYFLTAEGEVSSEHIRAELVAEVRERLDPEAAADAIELFDAYVAYRREAAEIGSDEDITLEDAAERLRDAHDRHLGDAAGFAGELERIDRAVTAARVMRDDDLDRDAKAEELAALVDSEEGREAAAPARAHRAVREAMARGADDAAVFAIRAEHLGEEAAERLAALDEERATWQARVESYRREAVRLREAIDDEAARAEAIETLRTERFSETEIARVRALERTGGAAR